MSFYPPTTWIEPPRQAKKRKIKQIREDPNKILLNRFFFGPKLMLNEIKDIFEIFILPFKLIGVAVNFVRRVHYLLLYNNKFITKDIISTVSKYVKIAKSRRLSLEKLVEVKHVEIALDLIDLTNPDFIFSPKDVNYPRSDFNSMKTLAILLFVKLYRY